MHLLDRYKKIGTHVCVHGPVCAHAADVTQEVRRCVALLLQQCGAAGAVPVDMIRNLQFQHLRTFNLCDASEGDQRLKYVFDLTRLPKTGHSKLNSLYL